MTDKEFRRLSRANLIEIIYELQQSEKALRSENESLRQQLENRRLIMENAGSLAEVLARLNGLFESAQATADDYQKNAKALMDEARRTKEEADAYFAGIQAKTLKRSGVTPKQRDEKPAKTREERRQLRKRLPQQCEDSPSLDDIFQSGKERCYDTACER